MMTKFMNEGAWFMCAALITILLVVGFFKLALWAVFGPVNTKKHERRKRKRRA